MRNAPTGAGRSACRRKYSARSLDPDCDDDPTLRGTASAGGGVLTCGRGVLTCGRCDWRTVESGAAGGGGSVAAGIVSKSNRWMSWPNIVARMGSGAIGRCGAGAGAPVACPTAVGRACAGSDDDGAGAAVTGVVS